MLKKMLNIFLTILYACVHIYTRNICIILLLLILQYTYCQKTAFDTSVHLVCNTLRLLLTFTKITFLSDIFTFSKVWLLGTFYNTVYSTHQLYGDFLASDFIYMAISLAEISLLLLILKLVQLTCMLPFLQMLIQMKTWCCIGKAVMSPWAPMTGFLCLSSSSRNFTLPPDWLFTAAQVDWQNKHWVLQRYFL